MMGLPLKWGLSLTLGMDEALRLRLKALAESVALLLSGRRRLRQLC